MWWTRGSVLLVLLCLPPPTMCCCMSFNVDHSKTFPEKNRRSQLFFARTGCLGVRLVVVVVVEVLAPGWADDRVQGYHPRLVPASCSLVRGGTMNAGRVIGSVFDRSRDWWCWVTATNGWRSWCILFLLDGALQYVHNRLLFDLTFFFQAEDGIRDCLLSRGLGDVYKRQICWQFFWHNWIFFKEHKAAESVFGFVKAAWLGFFWRA